MTRLHGFLISFCLLLPLPLAGCAGGANLGGTGEVTRIGDSSNDFSQIPTGGFGATPTKSVVAPAPPMAMSPPPMGTTATNGIGFESSSALAGGAPGKGAESTSSNSTGDNLQGAEVDESMGTDRKGRRSPIVNRVLLLAPGNLYPETVSRPVLSPFFDALAHIEPLASSPEGSSNL